MLSERPCTSHFSTAVSSGPSALNEDQIAERGAGMARRDD
jgi:hypothetical protein